MNLHFGNTKRWKVALPCVSRGSARGSACGLSPAAGEIETGISNAWLLSGPVTGITTWLRAQEDGRSLTKVMEVLWTSQYIAQSPEIVHMI